MSSEPITESLQNLSISRINSESFLAGYICTYLFSKNMKKVKGWNGSVRSSMTFDCVLVVWG